MNNLGVVQLFIGNDLALIHAEQELVGRSLVSELFREDEHKNCHFGFNDIIAGNFGSPGVDFLRRLVDLVEDGTPFLLNEVLAAAENSVFYCFEFLIVPLSTFVLCKVDSLEFLSNCVSAKHFPLF